MSQRRFLEDNENIQGEGRPNRYAASQEGTKGTYNQEPPTTWLDWLGIFGMMLLTYLVIVLVWACAISAVENGFIASVSCFMAAFVIYIAIVGFLWYRGLGQREELIRQFIQAKLREQAVEIGTA